MNILELSKYSSILVQNKEKILDIWMSFKIVVKTLEKYVDIDSFKLNYASLVFDYYIGVIDGKQEIGKCPVMDQFLEFFSEKNVPVHEIFIICSHLRVVLIDLSYEKGFSSRDVVSQINYVSDRNLSGVMERYKSVIESKTKLVKEYGAILQQYKDAIDESSIVSKTDTKGMITFVNDNFCKISGYEREELIGKPHNIVRHKDMSAAKFQDLWETIELKKSWNGVVVNRSKDGKPYFVNTIIFPIIDTNDEVIEYMSIRHDLTELFNLNHEIEDTQKEIIYKMGEIG